MKKLTFLLMALIVGAFSVQAGPGKAPARSQVYNDAGDYQQLEDSKIYYSIDRRYFASCVIQTLVGTPPAGPGFQTAISLLGEIDGKYYSTTFGSDEREGDDGRGAGFLAAFKVGNNSAHFLNSKTGSTYDKVTMTARIEAAGEQAALITYTLYNDDSQALTVSAGVYADVMIGANDSAALYTLKNEGEVYGIKMREDENDDESALFCALFGEGVTDVTPADKYWFGQYDHNFTAEQLVDNTYSDLIWDRTWPLSDFYDEHYMQEGVENGKYDSGMGFCWKNRTIPAKGTIEFSYIICVGEYDMSQPIGEDRFEYEVEAFDFDGWNDLSVAHPAHVFGYYEHPYGQHGYIEYQVDDENTWHRIPTELVSGENFDLNFDMFFNENRATDHVLNLRFNDDLGNITPMDGLSWTDVRSIPINGLEDRAYNGEPQIYEVTIGDGEPFTIGEDGAYTEPGDYTFGIEGAFAEKTIGYNEVEFSITVGQTIIRVDVPEDCLYDGNEHPATAEMVVGDGEIVITYKNTETGEISENAPVEPGTYEVFAEVINSVNFNDVPNASYGSFTIGLLDPEILVNIPEDCVYDGNEHAATAELIAGDGQIVITYVNTETGEVLTDAPVEPGNYDVYVEVINSVHYKDVPNTKCGNFTIDKAQSQIDFVIPEDCEYDGLAHGATVDLIVGDGDLTVTYVNTQTGEVLTDAPTEVGNYDVKVVVTETSRYYGIPETTIGNFTINAKQTGINELTVNSEDNGEWYTIDGRRVAAPSKGVIYIHNGKKILVK